jgi:nucleotide-binding universal stress UspA family protein
LVQDAWIALGGERAAAFQLFLTSTDQSGAPEVRQEIVMADSMLIGLDGSESSRRAVDVAVTHARAAGARVVVAYVIEWSPFTFNTPEENEQRHRRREEELARAHSQVLDPLVAKLQAAGLEVEGVVRHGHAAEVLAGLAKEFGTSQIVVGRRGQSTIATLLFGSVAGTLVQIAPVPVTVVP